MAGNTFGKNFRITTWGESHGEAIGCIIDGCPAGLELSEADIQPFMDRRHPQKQMVLNSYGIPMYVNCGETGFSEENDSRLQESSKCRAERDRVRILSGVYDGKTLGTPISIIIENADVRSEDYDDLKDVYRPGHADFTYDVKYGHRDYRGGGRSSGRETAARTAAGAVAVKILSRLGITFNTESEVAMVSSDSDSIGGIVQTSISGVPAGLGEPVFGKLDARLAGAVMSIGAVKAVEIGAGCMVSSLSGSANNDEYITSEDTVPDAVNHDQIHKLLMNNSRKSGQHIITKQTNNAGGISGGISDGDEIVLTAHIKPTPSISLPQTTINKYGEEVEIEIAGRHDECIAEKAAVVVESMCAMVLVDALFENMHSRMEDVESFYLSDN